MAHQIIGCLLDAAHGPTGLTPGTDGSSTEKEGGFHERGRSEFG
jgi:hypothetical protein